MSAPRKRPAQTRTPVSGVPEPGHTRLNRSPVYTPRLADAVCEMIRAGAALKTVEKQPGMPCADAIYAWARTDRDGFALRFRRAVEERAYRWAEEILDIADRATASDWKTRHLQIDTRKWLAAKFYPRMFGDRIATQQLGADGEPIDPRKNDLWARAVAKLPTEDLVELKRILEACGFGDETTSAPDSRATD